METQGEIATNERAGVPFSDANFPGDYGDKVYIDSGSESYEHWPNWSCGFCVISAYSTQANPYESQPLLHKADRRRLTSNTMLAPRGSVKVSTFAHVYMHSVPRTFAATFLGQVDQRTVRPIVVIKL